jgi:SPP1 gp7 family putative phage head morphogenesis protein
MKDRPHFREVLRQDSDRERIVTRAMPSISADLSVFRGRAMRSARNKTPLTASQLQPQIAHQLAVTMVTAHLRGRWRVLRDIAGRTLRLGLNADASEFLKNRIGLSSADFAKIQDSYSRTAATFSRAWSQKVVNEINKSIFESTARGEHVQDAMKRLHQAFITTGVSAANPWVLETIVRTQTQIAYSAGRENGLRDPSIQEILWGFEYVTVGDDRVRPTHAAMDGVRRGKADSIWNQWTPPCGWNCRCSKLPILKHEKSLTNETAIPTQTKGPDGKTVSVVPDAGFGKNWGNVHRELSAPPLFGEPTKLITEAILKNESQQIWEKSLDSPTKDAIKRWSLFGHKKIRQADWENSQVGEAAVDLRLIQNAIKHAPRFSGLIFRGIHDLPAEQISHLQVGDTVVARALTSATRSVENAEYFSNFNKETAPGTANVLFEMESHGSVSIENLSDVTVEREMLVEKGTAFQVESIEHKLVAQRDVVVVKLKQVDHAEKISSILSLSR